MRSCSGSMKGLLFFVSISLALPAILADSEEKYTTKFDYIDVDVILENPRQRNQYLNCYMGTGPCITPDAKFLKDILPEALVTKCRKCTERQKIILEKMIDWYVKNDPVTWNNVLKKSIEDLRNNRTSTR